MEKEWNAVFERLFWTMQQAGIAARMLQPIVQNEKKQAEVMQGETAYHRAMREAKTKADEIVQELLLQAMYEKREALFLDAEEDTALKHAFTGSEESSLIIDPIDGTLQYLLQKDSWSICAGIIEKGRVRCAMVYFPLRSRFYAYQEERGSLLYENAQFAAIEEGSRWEWKELSEKASRIYCNSRVPFSMRRFLNERGYELCEDEAIGCPDAILACVEGRARAYIGDSRNVRDILLGAIASCCESGYACDYQGAPLRWASKGRQKEAIFCRKKDARLLKDLREYARFLQKNK